MSLPRFLVSADALATPVSVLTGSELRHLRARRLRVGSELVLTDGRGREMHAVLVSLRHRQAVIRLVAAPGEQRESTLRLVLAQALLKRDRLELVIEKATELGVSELLLFKSARTVTRVAPDRRTRWERVCRSAAKQCQRRTVPVITGPVSWGEMLARQAESLKILFWEHQRDGLAALQQRLPQASSLLAVVGPEGGFSSTEVADAIAAGFHPIGLARRILRADTAAVAALTLCQFLWGDLAGGESRAATAGQEW